MTDLSGWYDDLTTLLNLLEDEALAANIREDVMSRIRKKLQTGPGAPLDLLTSDQLLKTSWPEPVWAVPELLPVGLCILAGKPKLGKSWLALQIALAIAAGGMALGKKVTQGPVLYLALEDSPRRLQERMKKQGWTTGLPAEFLPLGQFVNQIGDLRNGGGERMARQIEVKGYRMVVIDTLSRAVLGDQNDVQEMTVALTPLQEIAHKLNCGVVVIDHHRKSSDVSPDAITDILGSTGKGAMADTVWGLYRERGKADAKLSITGRDVDEQTLALKMDWLTGCWQSEGDADEIEVSQRQQELLETIKTFGKALLADLVTATGRNKGNIYKDLQELIAKHLINKTPTKKGEMYSLVETEYKNEEW